VIEFYDDSGVIGTVRVTDDGKLDASATMESIADAWARRRRPPSDFETFYDGWSNGYVSARRVADSTSDDDVGDQVTAASNASPTDESSITLEYDPRQPRDTIGQWTTDDEESDANWEDAVGMTAEQWGALSEAQRGALLAAVYAADGRGEKGAGAALSKLQGWVDNKIGEKSGGGGGGGAGAGKKQAARKTAERKAVDPDVTKKNHRDGFIAGESRDGKTRMSYDAKKKEYVVEKRDGKTWKESKRLAPEDAGKELGKKGTWFKPKPKPKPKKEPRRYKQVPKGTNVLDIISAANVGHTGAMIALVPSGVDAERIAVDGGEDAEQLHVTLAYLGEVALIPDDVRRWIVNAVSNCVEYMSTIVGDAFAVNMFNPPVITAGGGEPCVTLGVSGSQLGYAHDKICAVVNHALLSAGIEPHPQHKPWIPHITLIYTDDADLSYFTDRVGPVLFDAVRVAFGDEVYDIPLGDNDVDVDDGDEPTYTYDNYGNDADEYEDEDEDGDGDVGELEFTAAGEPLVPNVLFDWRAFQRERDVNIPGGPGHNLRNYWLRGKGAAKIRWNTPGDWTRCVAQLGKYVKDPKGLCSEYHKQATGMWTGDKRHRRMNAAVDDITASDVTMRYPTVEAAESECPPGHHMMPGGECMSDDEMTGEYAAEIAPADVTRTGSAAWRGVLTVEGVESGDGRMFDVNALTWDELPLPLRWQKEGAHGGQNDVTVAVGNVDKIWREPAGDGSQTNVIMGEGTLDLGNPDGREVFRRMRRGYMRGNSVDVDSVKGSDVELVFPQTGEEPLLAGEKSRQPVSPFAQPELTKYKKGRIRGTTLVEIPAFSEARLALVGTSEDDTSVDTSPTITSVDVADESSRPMPTDEERMVDQMIDIVAATSVIEITDAPPREWFNEPTDVEMTGALTITAEGRIYGYVAPADTRHRSFRDRTVYAPQKKVDYSRFHGGETIVADGGRVATGTITMDCGHATTSMNLTASQAADHYDNTCSMVASVRVGENRDGVWVAGALLPDVTPAQVRKMMASRLSGDWRTHLDRPGWREFVAALLVPVPGFAMARTAPSVSLREGTLVASSVPVEFTSRTQPRVGDDDSGSVDNAKNAAMTQSRVTLAVDRVRQARLASLRSRVALADKTPYGDVRYADPGYQADGVKRYPIDTDEHIRAAWAYINMPKNAAKYDKVNLQKVKARIRAAMNKIGADVQSDEE
jgi:hypothetical protein